MLYRPHNRLPPRKAGATRRQLLERRERFTRARREALQPDGPVALYGWHTVTAALANPDRRIRKLLVTENAERRLAEEQVQSRITPEIVRPGVIAERLPLRVQGLYLGPIPCPRPNSTSSSPPASCSCSTRSPTRTMSARSCERRRASRWRRS
jgi:23S rRNA (guanosine2251-2'-O)-methyltransferase